MKTFGMLIICILCLGAAGCASSYFPKYVVEMAVSRPGETGPEIISERGLLVTMNSYREDTALVEDDLVMINAAFLRDSIWFGLISRTNQPLKIIWAEATVTHGGITETLLPLITYSSVTESDLSPYILMGRGDPAYTDKPQPPMAIEPLGWVSVKTAPKSFLTFFTNQKVPQGGWTSAKKAFFNAKLDAKQERSERQALVAATVGQQVDVLVPLMTPDGQVEYTISFTIQSAEVGKYTDYIM